MLGVSPAATVGLHFMENYCGAPAYSGFPVTLTAFGIAPTGWQNLMQMDSGYGGCATPSLGYTLNQVITTTTTTGGLNPLANGSLNVTWFGPTANFAGFGGYAGPPPTYAYGGPYPYGGKPPTGEEQIYATFIRDGVNFGPPGGADNTGGAGGYYVDVTGLKTVFTNSPFVVELIAASDSMQTLTNAFVVDMVNAITNSVSYPNTPKVGNAGGAPWVRGQGGGLSTMSGAIDTDHIRIFSATPQHGTSDDPNGYDNAGTISGFIITDKPVVTMSPQPVNGGAGDDVTLRAYAVGVPPLSYQWRLNGQPIVGATGLTNAVGALSPAREGAYDLVVSNAYGMATSAVASVTIDRLTVGFSGSYIVDSSGATPAATGVNHGTSWQATNSDGTVTRTGVAAFNGSHPDQITVPGTTNFDATTGAIMFWVRSDITAYTGSNPPLLFDRHNGTGGIGSGDGMFLYLNSDGSLSFAASQGLAGFSSLKSVADTKWHHVALVYDQSATGTNRIYVDGAVDNLLGNFAEWVWPAGQELEFGLSHDNAAWQPFDGQMDDIRIYKGSITAADIASIYSQGTAVKPAQAVMRFNFDTSPVSGLTLQWRLKDVILQSSDSVAGPFVDVPSATSPVAVPPPFGPAKFYRYRGHSPVSILSNPYLM